MLTDLRKVFADRDAMSTEAILESLNELVDAPWGDIKGRPLDARGLAWRLKKYGVKSKTVRLDDGTPKGYARADLWDVWQRYVKQPGPHPQEAATSATSERTRRRETA